MDHVIIEKFGITSTTADSKDINDGAIKKEKRKSNNTELIFENIFVKEEGN